MREPPITATRTRHGRFVKIGNMPIGWRRKWSTILDFSAFWDMMRMMMVQERGREGEGRREKVGRKRERDRDREREESY